MYYSYKTYVSNNYKSQIAYVENNIYKNKEVEHSITYINIYKHMNTYSTVFDNHRIAKPHNVNKT